MSLRLIVPVLAALACATPQPRATPVTPAPPAAAPAPTPATTDGIAAAVAHPDRSAEAVERDVHRKPAETLRFMGLKPGQTVVDVMSARGYYTELAARVVGPQGVVYTQNNAWVLNRFAEEPIATLVAKPGLENVRRLDAELEALGLPDNSVDVAFMGLFYHDSVWLEADRAAMNSGIFRALKPGGAYVITDHHAQAGSGTRDVKTLHRIDREVVVAEVLEAGFVLDAESDVLRHPEDDRTKNVFDDTIRGETDRFALRFVKPVGP